MLNGLEKPESGRVLLDGADIWEKPKEISKVRFRVGLVMQYPEYQLFEETVAKDIAFGPKNMGLTEDEISARVREAAGIVGLDAGLLEKSPFELSGGEKRRAAIAGIIARKPEVLVLDEPAAGLDPAGRERILGTIQNFRAQTGATVIIVSHSMEDMAEVCDEIVVLLEGRILMSGSTREIFSRADELRRVGLDVPEITGLMLRLRDMGAEIDSIPFTVKDALPKLMKLLK